MVLVAIQVRLYFARDETHLLLFLKGMPNHTSSHFSGVLHRLHSPSQFKIEVGLLEVFVDHVLLIFTSEI